MSELWRKIKDSWQKIKTNLAFSLYELGLIIGICLIKSLIKPTLQNEYQNERYQKPVAPRIF